MTIGRGLPDPCLTNRDTGDWTFPYDQTMSGRRVGELSEQHGPSAMVIAVNGGGDRASGVRVPLGGRGTEWTLRVESV
jgi:hypothetical protein